MVHCEKPMPAFSHVALENPRALLDLDRAAGRLDPDLPVEGGRTDPDRVEGGPVSAVGGDGQHEILLAAAKVEPKLQPALTAPVRRLPVVLVEQGFGWLVGC